MTKTDIQVIENKADSQAEIKKEKYTNIYTNEQQQQKKKRTQAK